MSMRPFSTSHTPSVGIKKRPVRGAKKEAVAGLRRIARATRASGAWRGIAHGVPRCRLRGAGLYFDVRTRCDDRIPASLPTNVAQAQSDPKDGHILTRVYFHSTRARSH